MPPSNKRARRAPTTHALALPLLRQQLELREIAHEQRLCVDACLTRCQKAIQHLKTQGLAGGEAHRLDQYVSKAVIAMEQLAALKEYRTPAALRAFVRIYLLV